MSRRLLASQPCSFASLTSAPLLEWAERLRPTWDHDGSAGAVPLHRKLWEWFFITEALAERDMLRPGRPASALESDGSHSWRSSRRWAAK